MRNEHGFTLIEVMIAASLMTVALMSLAAMTLTSYGTVDGSGERTVAVTLAQQRIEWLRNQNFTSAALSAGTTIENLTGNYDGYTRTSTIAVDTPVAGVKLMTVTVDSPSGRSAQLLSLITD